jgi:hypothetical protein
MLDLSSSRSHSSYESPSRPVMEICFAFCGHQDLYNRRVKNILEIYSQTVTERSVLFSSSFYFLQRYHMPLLKCYVATKYC